MSEESVILVDSRDRRTGEAPKIAAHRNPGQRHRAVSVVVVNTANRILLQRRSAATYHFAGLWSNSCCTHPRPGEQSVRAAQRRLHEEMGIRIRLRAVGKFEYRAVDSVSGLVEHEIDHVFVGRFDGNPEPNATWVADWSWVDMAGLRSAVARSSARYTPWLLPVLDQVQRGQDSAVSFDAKHAEL